MRLTVTMTVRWIMVIGLACGLGTGGLLAFAQPAHGHPDAPLQAALARWQAHQPAHYRLVVQQDTADSSCRQAVEVLYERVQTVQTDGCDPDSAWTISSLLDWISFRAQPTSACDSAIACFCYVHSAANAVYDPQLGYPYVVTYQRTFAPNWDFLKYWQRLWGYNALPKCATDATSQILLIRVVSLTALP